jgi:hypothetical protein
MRQIVAVQRRRLDRPMGEGGFVLGCDEMPRMGTKKNQHRREAMLVVFIRSAVRRQETRRWRGAEER